MLKKLVIIVGSVIGAFILIGAIAAVASPTKSAAPKTPAVTTLAPVATTTPAVSTTPAVPTTTKPPAPATTTTAAPTVVRTAKTVVFTVTGSASSGADITYGTDSINDSPPGDLGVLADGTAVPWSGWLRYNAGAMYWDVSAQLDGGGSIKCSVSVRVEQWWSDGTHRSGSKTVASGQASGNYNICDAEST